MIPRRVLKSDGLTLHPYFLAKAVDRPQTSTRSKLARFADDRNAVPLKILLLALIALLAALLEIVR